MFCASCTLPLGLFFSYLVYVQVFVFVNESTVKKYKSALADEIEPAITELIGSVEQGLATLERKEAILRTKVSKFSYCRCSAST